VACPYSDRHAPYSDRLLTPDPLTPCACSCPSQGSRQLSRAFSEPQERAKSGLGRAPLVEEGQWGALLDFEVKQEEGEGGGMGMREEEEGGGGGGGGGGRGAVWD